MFLKSQISVLKNVQNVSKWLISVNRKNWMGETPHPADTGMSMKRILMWCTILMLLRRFLRISFDISQT